MTLDRERLIGRLKRATESMTGRQICEKMAAHPLGGNPLRPHISAALAGKEGYDYLLAAMGTVFLTGNWAVRKTTEFTNETMLEEV